MPGFVPSWLVPADPAAHYAQGFGLGLQQEAQQSREALALEELNRRAQEQAASERQFAEQMQLQQQQLAIRQAEEQRAAGVAAQQQAARQEYQQRVAAGEDAMKVLSEMWPRIQGGSPEAALIRAQMQAQKQGAAPTPFKDESGKVIGYYNKNTGAFQMLRGEMTPYQTDILIKQFQDQINKVMESNPDLAQTEIDPNWNQVRKNRWTGGRQAIKRIESRIQKLLGESDTGDLTGEYEKLPGALDWVRDPKTGKLIPAGATAAMTVPRGTLPAPAASTAPPTLSLGGYYGMNRVPSWLTAAPR